MEKDKTGYFNGGVPDPTCWAAVLEKEDRLERFRTCLDEIYKACKENGFYLEEHVVLRDKFSGKVFR